MKVHFVFSSGQILYFKHLAYVVSDALKLYNDKNIPSKTGMLDIFASVIGYRGYQDFIRQSKGHTATSGAPLRLTAENFLVLSKRLENALDGLYTEPQCCWAIASLFDLEKTGILSEEDIALLERHLIRTAPIPLDDRKKRLIALGCLVAEARSFDNEPDLGEIIVGYHVTELGQYAAAHEIERQKARSLSEIGLARWGLPQALCRLQHVSSSLVTKWEPARIV
jgi:hypothetical protein